MLKSNIPSVSCGFSFRYFMTMLLSKATAITCLLLPTQIRFTGYLEVATAVVVPRAVCILLP